MTLDKNGCGALGIVTLDLRQECLVVPLVL